MTAGKPIALAIYCDHHTQISSIAPFIDLARLSEQAGAHDPDNGGDPHFAIDLLTLDPPPDRRFRIPAMPLSRAAQHYDAVIVSASDDIIDPGRPVPDELTRWLGAQHRAGALLVGIGSGPLAFAAAGLLGGDPVAISPRFAQAMRRVHPGVNLAHGGSITEQSRIICAAEAFFSAALAVRLAERLHSGGLAERYRRVFGLREDVLSGANRLPGRGNLDLLVAEARAFIFARMKEGITTDDLARHFRMHKRTLTRRFERSTGTTPARFIRAAQIDAASAMLSRTQMSVEEIGFAIGYQDTASFRAAFREHTGLSPREFRMQRIPGGEEKPRGRLSISLLQGGLSGGGDQRS